MQTSAPYDVNLLILVSYLCPTIKAYYGINTIDTLIISSYRIIFDSFCRFLMESSMRMIVQSSCFFRLSIVLTSCLTHLEVVMVVKSLQIIVIQKITLAEHQRNMHGYQIAIINTTNDSNNNNYINHEKGKFS